MESNTHGKILKKLKWMNGEFNFKNLIQITRIFKINGMSMEKLSVKKKKLNMQKIFMILNHLEQLIKA
jgi:hypothetical protein